MSSAEIRRLLQVLRSVFGYLDDLRAKDKLASEIQYPKIPPRLSESLVMEMIGRGRILPTLENASLVRGKRDKARGEDADIVAKLDGKKTLVEVKATGESGFSALYEKDLDADAIVWVHFGNYCSNARTRTVSAYVVEKPRARELPKGKIGIKTFRAKATTTIEYDLSETPAADANTKPTRQPTNGTAVQRDGRGSPLQFVASPSLPGYSATVVLPFKK